MFGFRSDQAERAVSARGVAAVMAVHRGADVMVMLLLVIELQETDEGLRSDDGGRRGRGRGRRTATVVGAGGGGGGRRGRRTRPDDGRRRRRPLDRHAEVDRSGRHRDLHRVVAAGP